MNLLNQTIGDIWKQRVALTPEQTAAEFEDMIISWKEMDLLSDWLVHRFHFLGIRKGTRAAIWGGNHLQWLLVYIGLQKIGAVAVLVNPNYQEAELQNVLISAEIEYLFYGEQFRSNQLPEIISRMDVKHYPYLRQTIPIELKEAVDFMVRGAGLLKQEEKEQIQILRQQVKPEDTACMLFTSGTTMVPKGVLLSHYSLVNNARATVDAMHWGKDDKICVMVPFFHCFGMTSCILAGIVSGASLLILRQYRTKDAIKAITEKGCTVLNGVPSMFLALIHNPDFDPAEQLPLRSGIIAGSPVTPEQYRKICRQLRLSHLQMSYGQTEASPAISFSGFHDSIDDKAQNAGIILEHLELCLWKDGRQYLESADDFPYGATGEIGVRGYSVMQGYYHREKETAKALQDGWLHTGDLGFLDRTRHLTIVGRASEMIIRGGENISPTEIEACILKLPEIREVKVLGIEQEILQEEIAACIVCEAGRIVTEEQIRDHVGKYLSYYKVPRYICMMDTMPTTSSGKISNTKLKEYVISQCKCR